MNDLRLGMIQMNSNVKDRDANVTKALAYIDEVADQNADLIVLPEFFNTEYFAQYWDYSYVDYAEPADGYTISRIREKAAERGVYIMATIYEYEAPGLQYDTAFLIDDTGAIVGKYRKVHPAAVLSLETIYYRRGNRFPIWDVKGFKVGAVICYDHLFPEAARSVAVNGAEIVLGPFATNGIANWDALMTTRAFENGVYMAPCNKVGREDGWTFSGRSLVVDPFGEQVHRASDTDDETFVVEISRERLLAARTRYPMLRDRRPEAYGALVNVDEVNRSLPTHL